MVLFNEIERCRTPPSFEIIDSMGIGHVNAPIRRAMILRTFDNDIEEEVDFWKHRIRAISEVFLQESCDFQIRVGVGTSQSKK